ncbi:MAG: hypothetical protein ACRD1H_20910, partial [Vicinamibacterales bacterium]
MTWLDVGSPGDDEYVTGVFPAEHNVAESYRWTTGSAMVTVPVPSDSRYRVDIKIATTGAERRLTIDCPGGGLRTQLVAGKSPSDSTLECDGEAGRIPIEIEVETTRVVADGRPLGIAVVDVRASAVETTEIFLWRLHASLAIAT